MLPGTRRNAQLGRVLQGEETPTCHSSGQGPLYPEGGPLGPGQGSQAWRYFSGGSWAGAAREEGTSKAPLIPGDIFRHRSLLFYAADRSPELYK